MNHPDTSATVGLDSMESDVKVSFHVFCCCCCCFFLFTTYHSGEANAFCVSKPMPLCAN